MRTIRYWSDIGALPPDGRTSAGFRFYGTESVARLQLVRTLRELGLGHAEVRRVMQRETTVATVAAVHVRALDAQIRALRLSRAVLSTVARRQSDTEEIELRRRPSVGRGRGGPRRTPRYGRRRPPAAPRFWSVSRRAWTRRPSATGSCWRSSAVSGHARRRRRTINGWRRPCERTAEPAWVPAHLGAPLPGDLHRPGRGTASWPQAPNVEDRWMPIWTSLRPRSIQRPTTCGRIRHSSPLAADSRHRTAAQRRGAGDQHGPCRSENPHRRGRPRRRRARNSAGRPAGGGGNPARGRSGAP